MSVRFESLWPMSLLCPHTSYRVADAVTEEEWDGDTASLGRTEVADDLARIMALSEPAGARTAGAYWRATRQVYHTGVRPPGVPAGSTLQAPEPRGNLGASAGRERWFDGAILQGRHDNRLRSIPTGVFLLRVPPWFSP